MAKTNNMFDISQKITNKLPTLKITEDIICTVNNRKSNVLNVQAMVRQMEKKNEEDEEEDKFAVMQKSLEMLIGAKDAKRIEEMDLPITEYTDIFQAVMAASQGKTLEELDTP
ncbi:MAG: hypothetical protein K2N61_13150 [Lachnospiraceae bacterium]|nr:hypothetical protein [Lachnospiraceae bacterium]